MEINEIAHLDRTSEGITVTFGDGYTFLFSSEVLYGIRLKSGQLIESPKYCLLYPLLQ